MQQANTDQLYQKFARQNRIPPIQLFCSNENPAIVLCTDQTCQKASAFCHKLDCQACEEHRINGCQTVSFSFLINEAKQRQNNAKRLFEIMKKQLFRTMAKLEQECLAQDWVYGDLKPNTKRLYRQILDQQRCSASKKVLHELATKLRSFKKSWKKGNFLIKSVQARLDSLTKKIQEVTNDITSQIFSNQGQIDSVILPFKDPEWQFILQSLDFPKHLELVFRASQHNFRSSSFHEKCDKFEDTFVLIKNEHNKLIGGFTPLSWKVAFYAKFDSKKQSLLLDISAHGVMRLRYQAAIVCSEQYGPVFGFDGVDSDLRIVDHCNLNRNNFFNPGVRYELEGQSFQNYVLDPNTFLFDIADDRQFKVVEYQVFRVVWHK